MSDKIVSLEKLSHNIPRPIVHCHGCFDFLHHGHIQHLEDAKNKGMTLVITVTSDRYVNKGEGRPIFNHQQRAEMLAALSFVDYVVINDASDARRALEVIRPDFYIKGQDYKQVVCDEFDIAKKVGAEIIFTGTEKLSTTEFLQKLPRETLQQRYYRLSCEHSDINEHMETLYQYARQCSHITELGTRRGVSTTSFLYAQPRKLICYDIERTTDVNELERLKGNTQFIFHEQNDLDGHIEPTDLLFIDTEHTYEQLKAELEKHGGNAKKYIILHDTSTAKCMLPAIDEFLKNDVFVIKEKFENCCGLTVLERERPWNN